MSKRRKFKKMLYFVLIIILVALIPLAWLLWIAAGQVPNDQRLERCERSPQWHDGQFVNTHPTPHLTGDKPMPVVMWNFLFGQIENLKPDSDLPLVKTPLRHLARDKEVCLWLGHSTVFIQTGGVRYLFDPVLTSKLPVTLFMRPFKGTDGYTPDDIPEVDYLIITHDHWDHLDWRTVTAIRDRVKHVVCPLGVGQHFEYWDYDTQLISELDWNDSIAVNDSATLRCLPSRHFSGRLFGRNLTLWASYLIDGPRRIYVSGDGGYDDRFKNIGTQYPGIDLAVMENGQYNLDWKYIHTLPGQLPQAIDDLNPKRVLTYHNSKYALARHAWTEPLDSILVNARNHPWKLLTPRIGETIDLDRDQTFSKWW